MQNIEELFSKELAFIKNEELRNYVVTMLDSLPDYFFTASASSSGKYHPQYALGDGGLVRHTKAAVNIYNLLSENGVIFDLISDYDCYDEQNLEEISDVIFASLILHDGLKAGWTTDLKPSSTSFNHPLLMGDYIIEVALEIGYSDMITIYGIADCIKSHMGQWNTNIYEKETVLPLPKTPEQKIVHLCDYLASRKSLEYVF